MIKKIFNEIRSDAIGSKVIANIVTVVGGFIIVLVYSLLTPKTVKELLKEVWEYSTTFEFEFRLMYVVGVIGLLWILIGVVSKLIKKYVVLDEKERIRRFCDANNKKTVEGRIVFRYTTYINSRTKLPAITNLAMYCIAQEPSIEISDYSGCRHYNCVNNSDLPDVIDMTKIIESHLIEKWELINNL